MNDEDGGPLLASRSSVDSSYSHDAGQIAPSGAHLTFPPPVLLTNFRPAWKTQLSFCFILLTETLERTAFYGLVCNLVLFLNSQPLHWTSYHAMDAQFVLNGLSYLLAIFGGWIADACLGKFRTICLFFVLYIAGFAVWPALYPYPLHKNVATAPGWCSQGRNTTASYSDYHRLPASYLYSRSAFPGSVAEYFESSTRAPELFHAGRSSNLTNFLASSTSEPAPSIAGESCSWAVFLSISVIAVGYGAVRANIIPFGAHQFEHEGRTAVRIYFNWFYWSINIGALIAYGVIGYVQQEQSYFWGYLAPLIVLCVAFFTFVCGSCVYVKKSATGSVLTNILTVCKESLCLFCRSRRRRDLEILNTNALLNGDESPACLDFARSRYGGSFADNAVDDVKQLGRIMAIFLSMIPYWTVYYQMQTTFVVQGFHMQLDFDHNDTMAAADVRTFTIPAAWLSLFNVLFVLILLPVLDRLVYPYLDRKGWSPSLRARIILGMCLAVFAVTSAGVLEHYRLSIYWQGGTNHTHYQKIGDTYYLAAKLSVLYQLPQYAVIGISELFASIAGLELAYIYAPRSMQGIIMGLYWFSQGLGSFLGTALMTAFQSVWFTPWDYGDINCAESPFVSKSSHCHLDYYFYFLAGLQVLGIAVFSFMSWWLEVGGRIPLRVQEDGQTIIRGSEAPSGASTRSASPYSVDGDRGASRRNRDDLIG